MAAERQYSTLASFVIVLQVFVSGSQQTLVFAHTRKTAREILTSFYRSLTMGISIARGNNCIITQRAFRTFTHS